MDGPEVFTKWLGESEEAIRHIFRVARQLAPSIVFFDQLDALAPLRSADSGSRTTQRVVNQLLAELDGMGGAGERLYARLAAETEGLSGADIQAVCVQAKMSALKRADYGALPPLTEADFSA